MKKLVIKFYKWYTDCSEAELAARFDINLALYDSRFKAYLYTLLDKR